ncbi:unnamed protein product, partial [Porites evermanni]
MAGVNSRFAQVSEVEILQIQDKAVPENTKKATKYGLKVFKAWFFYNPLLWSKRKGKPASIDKIKPKALQNPNSGLEYFKLNRETQGGVFSTKNHQGSLNGTDDPSDGKMFEGKGLAICPVVVVKAYLFHLNPKCEALFQKPSTGPKFKPSSYVIWYSTLPLGHKTIDSMMKNMCLRA